MDLKFDNPVGRVPNTAEHRTADLYLNEDGWRLKRSKGNWKRPLSSALRHLDTVHSLTVSGIPPQDKIAETVRFLSQAICRGTALTTAPTQLAAEFHNELKSSIRTFPTGSPGKLAWDIAAVSQRRHALRPLINNLPSVSIVLVSRRSDLVVPMVKRLSKIDYPDFEIIVGLHGVPEPQELSQLKIDPELVVKSFPDDQIFGSVVNDAFKLASGTLVTKVDDDDYYSNDHVWDLVAAHRYSGACLVGKSTTTIFLEGLDTTVRRSYGVREGYTHRVAGGTMLLRQSDLWELGGWPTVPRAVDTALISAIRKERQHIYQPHDIGYVYVRTAKGDHTWIAKNSSFLRNADEQWIGLYRHSELGTNA